MKIIYSILLMLVGSLCVSAQGQNFVLNGKMPGNDNKKLILMYRVGVILIKDSTMVVNGGFQFKGNIAEPVMAYLSDGGPSGANTNYQSFFIEPGSLEMDLPNGSFQQMKVQGSKTQEQMDLLEGRKAAIYKEMQPRSTAFSAANTLYRNAIKAKQPESELIALKDKADKLHEQLEPYSAQLKALDLAYVREHPQSFYAAYLFKFQTNSLPVSESEAFYRQLPENIKSGSTGKAILSEINSLRSGSPGSMAFNFNAADINGAMISPGDFKTKKYVILDFWASWCAPCRKGNPHLLSLYQKYQSKGLEIIGISDDDSKPEEWKKAVEHDHIGIWQHVLRGLKRTKDGYDQSNDINVHYGIHTIPTKILIDKEGRIVGRYGEGKDDEDSLDKQLAGIFKN